MCEDYHDYKEAFDDFVKALKMTKMSLEVWANTDERRTQVIGKIDTLESAIRLGETIYSNVKEKQGA